MDGNGDFQPFPHVNSWNHPIETMVVQGTRYDLRMVYIPADERHKTQQVM